MSNINALLSSVGVLRALVHFEVTDTNVLTELALGKHAVHGLFDDALRDALLEVLEALELPPTGTSRTRLLVERVTEVCLVLELVTCDLDLLRIDDDDGATHVHRRRVGRQVLTTDNISDERGDPTESLALGIHNVPWLVQVEGVIRRGIVGSVPLQEEKMRNKCRTSVG